MVPGENVQKFTVAVIMLAKIFPGIRDEFFAKIFYRKLCRLVSAYVRFVGEPDSPGVAQYRTDCIGALNQCLEMLEYFSHLKMVPPTPLLFADHALLRLRLELTSAVPQKIKKETESAPKKEIAARPQRTKKEKKEMKLNTNQEGIFNFVKRFPNVRTKDVIEQFSAISQRTVKRNLKELVSSGFLHKRSENKAVFYSAADSN